ncbi:hypothetical protein [Nocardia wallacei]|uniref:hypothetical protein n=1 Tax=Nocardia wallacei TaxID=480035 RepID=UPI002453B2A4|nr:hypothetical protein [Nocardia wallacei]
MDTFAADRIAKAARKKPESRTATTGFGQRATASAIEMPHWVAVLAERSSPQLAGYTAALFHMPTLSSQRGDSANCAIKAEGMARAVERARRRGQPGIAFDYTTELDDDADFYNAVHHHLPWTGRWYSREPAEA